MESEKKNIGGIWEKTSKTGNRFMSGSIEIEGKKHQFVMFKNKYKNGESHPDYVIFPSTPLPGKPVHPAVKAITDSFTDVPEQELPF